MNAKAKKALIITGIVIASIVGVFLLLYAVLWIINGAMYKESRAHREYVCRIPALGDGFTPQGIGYSAETDTYIMTGYNGELAELYLVKNDNAKRVNIAGADGKALRSHGGGATCTKDYVYVTGEYEVYAYSLSELMVAAGSSAKVAPLSVVNVNTRAAFCFSDETRLFVGEFYRKGNYETDKAHHYKTPNGQQNRAIVTCFPLDGNGMVESKFPDYAISVTDLVQGFTVSGDTYMLSRSYGLKNSKLEYYSAPKLQDGATVMLDFKNDAGAGAKAVPLYYLDDSALKRTLTLPAFGEDLTIAKDRVVITNEAACNKYFIGKLFGANKVYSYPIF